MAFNYSVATELPLDTRNIYGQYLGAGSIGILLLFCCIFWVAGSTRRRREQAFLAMEQEYYEKVRTGSDADRLGDHFADFAEAKKNEPARAVTGLVAAEDEKEEGGGEKSGMV